MKGSPFGAICRLLLLLFLVMESLTAQPVTIIDSLNRELLYAGNPEDSVALLCRLSWSISSSDPTKTFQHAMTALEISGRIINKKLIAEAYDAAALGYRIKNDLEKAKELYQHALRISEEIDVPIRIAWENYNLAEIAVQERQFDKAKRYAEKSRVTFGSLNNFRKVIDNDWMLIKIGGNDKSSYIDSAIHDCKHAVRFARDSAQLLIVYLDLIRLYGLQENKTQSMLYSMKALEIAEAVNDKRAILKACYQIAEYLSEYQHNYDVALLYYQQILEICKADSAEAGMAGVLNDMGNVYKLTGNDSLALSLYNESLHIAERLKHRHSIANAYRNIGELYFQKKNFQDAFTYYSKCYETGCDKCPPIAFHQVLINMGQVYLAAGDDKNALKFFNKSLSLADSADANYERAVSYSALADVYQSEHNTAAAVEHYRTALNLASNANSLSLRKESALKLSEAYSRRKNYKEAYKYLELSKSIADSLHKIGEAENLSRLETKFEFQNLKAQKELDEARADEEIREQAQQKYIFLAGFLLVTVFVAVIYSNFRRKKKDNAVLERQKLQIEEMSGEIHEADQKKLSFFTNISHELKTPLTLILGPTEKLIAGNTNNQNSGLLSIIRRNTLHLHNLINQLLDIRKLDTGNIKLRVAEGDIAGYCKGIYSTFCHIAEENNITYSFHTSEETIIGWFDRDILEKALNNLLSNAFKYTPQGGTICLTLSAIFKPEHEPAQVEIVVRDNGKGIPDDQVQYVFDRYYQVENTNTGFNTGTGIGLAYTKELIGLHKGSLRLESKLNHGSTFTLRLPIDETCYLPGEKSGGNGAQEENGSTDVRQKYLEEIIAMESAETQAEVPYSGKADEESKIMLIVEDNSDLRTFLKSIFADEYMIYEAAEGNTGRRIANELIPDVIISDIMMPGMDGLELTRMLKSNIHTNHIPILILTAKTGDEHEMEGLKTGADDYLTKPFNAEILSMRVNRLVESKKKLREYFTREFLLNPKEVKLASPEDEFLKKAVKVVENNIANPNLNVEMLMEALCVSRMQLHRKLKALTNYSANVFIRNIKLKRAAQLLRQKSLNITEVLYESGFNSPSYFSSCFKEMYGCVPKEYSSMLQD